MSESDFLHYLFPSFRHTIYAVKITDSVPGRLQLGPWIFDSEINPKNNLIEGDKIENKKNSNIANKNTNDNNDNNDYNDVSDDNDNLILKNISANNIFILDRMGMGSTQSPSPGLGSTFKTCLQSATSSLSTTFVFSHYSARSVNFTRVILPTISASLSLLSENPTVKDLENFNIKFHKKLKRTYDVQQGQDLLVEILNFFESINVISFYYSSKNYNGKFNELRSHDEPEYTKIKKIKKIEQNIPKIELRTNYDNPGKENNLVLEKKKAIETLKNLKTQLEVEVEVGHGDVSTSLERTKILKLLLTKTNRMKQMGFPENIIEEFIKKEYLKYSHLFEDYYTILSSLKNIEMKDNEQNKKNEKNKNDEKIGRNGILSEGSSSHSSPITRSARTDEISPSLTTTSTTKPSRLSTSTTTSSSSTSTSPTTPSTSTSSSTSATTPASTSAATSSTSDTTLTVKKVGGLNVKQGKKKKTQGKINKNTFLLKK